MSSVPKSRRYPTDAKFITELKELKAITIRKCTRFPKRYNATVADHLLKSALNGKHFAYQANAVFPRAKGQAELRKNLFVQACSELEALASDVDDLTEMGDIFHISIVDLEEWTGKIYQILSMIQHVMDSDEKRFSKLP